MRFVSLGLCLLTPVWASQLHVSSARDEQVSVFVAVFTRRNGGVRRNLTRAMWTHARDSTQDNITVKFAVCNKAEDGEPSSVADSIEEELSYGDVELLDCNEGYGEGALTRKVLAAMKLYVEKHRNSFFMKIDDDTFISWKRYAQWLRKKGTPNLYMGIEIGEAKPCRIPSFLWYEPYTTFPDPVFPKGMSGGSGYTVGLDLVDTIINSGLGMQHVLFNEDRSVGVWMKTLVNSGKPVNYVGMPGVDGFWAWDWRKPVQAFSSWKKYPFVVHHGLEPETIRCLALVDAADDSDREVGDCFVPEVGKQHEPLRCASMNTDSV